ncbi:hypothetical protein G4D82_11620 [Flavobacterium sp. CYK-4]|uniref:hypothetical protein n=1 Tax=Flavobacterium lotistagni TaxID=2709660 RepID=UPI00140A05AA|nr:hypothetical protein [Flavobacterium lotistagni]NHM07872.1 hypothetical protein [Flavobacterium lotistagni]
MKKLLNCLAFAMLSWHSFAQEIPVKVTKSELFKDEYKNSNIELVEDDGSGGVLIVRSYAGGIFSSGLGYYFEHYDSNLKLLKEYEYQSKQTKGDRKTYGVILGTISNGNQISMIEYLYDKTEKAYICNALTSDINDFNFTTKELFRISYEQVEKRGSKVSFFGIGGGAANYDSDRGAQMIINEDRSAFAITIDIQDKAAETHKIYLFDKALNQKLDHTFKRDIKDRKFVYENIDVSKDGNILYLLGKAKTEEAKKKKDGGRYQYELTRITSTDSKTQVFDTEDHYAASLKTIIFQDRLTCVGFYSDRNDNRFKGISYFELDPTTLAIKKSKYNPFTEQFMIDKYGKNKDKELKNVSFKKMIINTQNEIILNAEEFYITTTTTYSPQGGTRTYTIYHYDDIISAKIGASGDIIWARNINKRQDYPTLNPYFSFTSAAKGSDAYFFINTGEKVRKIRRDRIEFKEASAKRSNLNIIRINENGDFDYREVLDDKDNEVPFMVANGELSGDSVFFLGQKGKKKQILKLTL